MYVSQIPYCIPIWSFLPIRSFPQIQTPNPKTPQIHQSYLVGSSAGPLNPKPSPHKPRQPQLPHNLLGLRPLLVLPEPLPAPLPLLPIVHLSYSQSAPVHQPIHHSHISSPTDSKKDKTHKATNPTSCPPSPEPPTPPSSASPPSPSPPPPPPQAPHPPAA